MGKLGISAALLAGLTISACQFFTAGETVSEPNPAEVRRAGAHGRPGAEAQEKGAMPNDAVHAEAAKAKAAEPAPPAAPTEMATAAHILIRYAGAMRTTAEVTRSKGDARKLAEQVAKKAKASGADFVALANEYTEDPSGKGQGGRLGTFPRGRMVPEFDKPVFAMKPGQVSDVIETGFGFHIIKREN